MQSNRLQHAYDLAAEALSTNGVKFDELEDCNHRSVGEHGERVDIVARLEREETAAVRITRWQTGSYDIQYLY